MSIRRTPTAAALQAALFLIAALSCSTPEVSSGPGGSGSNGTGSGNPGGGGPGSGAGPKTPEISLPDASASAPPPAAPAQCASEAHKAEVVPLDLLLLLDASGSMTGAAGMRSKWATAQTALRAFVSDPRSAGLGVGLLFFPQDKTCMTDADCLAAPTTGGAYCKAPQICAGAGGPTPDAIGCGSGGSGIILLPPFGGGTRPPVCPMGTTCQPFGECSTSGAYCTGVGMPCPMGGGTCMPAVKTCRFTTADTECDQALYEKPNVTIGTLPMAEPALVRRLMAKEPTGGTPMGPAVTGALKHLREHLAANPGRKAVLVLASDGFPSPCGGVGDIPSIQANLQAAFMGSPSISTYVIGVFSQLEVQRAQMTLDLLASAGGSRSAIVVTANDDLTMRLQSALNEIRGAALACEYKIPASQSGKLDFGKVNLRYTSGATSENLPYVERADRCDPVRGGWYYDVAPGMGTPTKVVVCESNCKQFKLDQKSQVELVFGCVTDTIR